MEVQLHIRICWIQIDHVQVNFHHPWVWYESGFIAVQGSFDLEIVSITKQLEALNGWTNIGMLFDQQLQQLSFTSARNFLLIV